MADDMADNGPVVTLTITREVIAGLDPAIHHFRKNALTKFDGYAGQARV
jgi:hypothetical protein